jgi:sarcosine oxidase subunit gamma
MNQTRDQLRHEPLAHLALAAGQGQPDDDGIALQALPYQPSFILRGESDDAAFLEAFRGGLGFNLPLAPNHAAGGAGVTAYWLGPSEWLLLGPAVSESLSQALAGTRHAMVENGDGQQVIALSGPRARDVLAKLCPLDLDGADLNGADLAPGRCARSILAGCDMLLVPQDDGAYYIHVARSFADYAWRSLADACREFGLPVAD